ncbi:linear amide C-N hydrolase [Poriferisphaera sp. WC338]|uniref:linear amide C-N hydrolase n=1 Tax=Poriferisphaera sp. WC338 TaxID=3425129 RepID=UPI003D81C16C
MRLYNYLTILCTFSISLLFFMGGAHACTEFCIASNDGSHIVGRSMEFGLDLQSNIITQPRDHQFQMSTPDGKLSLAWKNKFGYAALNALGSDIISDGLNDQGLSASALYLPKFSKYQQILPQQNHLAVPNDLLVHYILGNFKTIEQVKQAIPEIVVYARPNADIGNKPFPLHYSVYDRTGQGIVIEYTTEGLNIYDNTPRVLTNSPPFPWHLDNLQNYLNLSPNNPAPKTLGNQTFSPAGQGFGMCGLPGDSTPPSRFVRIFALKAASTPTNTTEQTINLAFHLLNTVDVIRGTVRPATTAKDQSPDYTQWIVIKDLTNLKLYVRTYDSLSISTLDLKQLDLSPGAPVMKIPIAEQQKPLDLLKNLQSQSK